LGQTVTPEATPRLKSRSVFSGNVAVISLTIAATLTAINMFWPILPLAFRDLGATDLQVSVAYSLILGTVYLMQLPGGMLADRFGRRPVMVYSFALAGVCLVGASFARSWIALTVSLVAFEAAWAPSLAIVGITVGESVAAERTGEAVSVMEILASVGMGVGPAIGALLVGFVPFRTFLLICGLICLGCSLVRGIWLKETLKGLRPGGARVSAGTQGGAPRRRGLGAVLRGPVLWLAVVVTCLETGGSLTWWGPFLPLFAHDGLGLAKPHIDAMFSVGPLVAAALGIVMLRVMDRFGAPRVTAGGFLAAGIGFSAFFAVGGFGSAVLAMSFIWLAIQLGMAGIETLKVAVTSPEQRGAVAGAVGAFGGVTAALVTPVVGKIATRLGPGIGLWIGAAFFAVGAAAALALRRSIARSGNEPTSEPGSPGPGLASSGESG